MYRHEVVEKLEAQVVGLNNVNALIEHFENFNASDYEDLTGMNFSWEEDEAWWKWSDDDLEEWPLADVQEVARELAQELAQELAEELRAESL